MLLWETSAQGISTLLLVTLLIGRVRSFPALEVSNGDVQPSQIGKKEATGADFGATSQNSTDDTAASRASEEQAIKVPQGEEPLAQPVRLDYYDYLQLPNDPDDELPALPDHAVNVNEDYAGIYDYRGSQDGRFRRKRTLTTNLEQFLTRSSRIRSKRSPIPDENIANVSPAERAENLLSVLTALQESDPEFDASEFLKVLDAPSVSEQDLEYLLLLSNPETQREAAIPRDILPLPVAYYRSVLGRIRNPDQTRPRDSFHSSVDESTDGASRDRGSWMEDSGQSRPSQKTDVPRLYAITSLMSARGPTAGIAM